MALFLVLLYQACWCFLCCRQVFSWTLLLSRSSVEGSKSDPCPRMTAFLTLQVTGTEIAPVNTQPQTMMMQALLGLFGSQSTFLFNRIGAVWSGKDDPCDG